MRSGGDASPLSALDVTATEFLRNLTRLGLVNLLRAYGTSGLRKDAIARDRATLCPDLSEAVDLLCLSQPVPEAAAVAVLTEPMLEHMVDIGVAATGDETVQLPGIRLVDHLGSILFVAASQNNGYGYYGRDSIGLGRQLLGAGGRCLDLCCSTGCQTAVLAATAESVVSVEIDASLAPLFELNMCLNGVRSRVEPRWSDVREVEFDEPFDVVAVNAPMMPTFGVFDLPWLVDGGVDGAGLLKGILGRVPLAANGRLHGHLDDPWQCRRTSDRLAARTRRGSGLVGDRDANRSRAAERRLGLRKGIHGTAPGGTYGYGGSAR